jgi:hypothetical protein
MNTLSRYIPYHIVLHILQYDNRFAIRNGKPMNRISKDDYRYEMIEDIFRIIPSPAFYYYGPNIMIDLEINRHKSYCILIENQYVRVSQYNQDNENNDDTAGKYRIEITKKLIFHRTHCMPVLLFEK